MRAINLFVIFVFLLAACGAAPQAAEQPTSAPTIAATAAPPAVSRRLPPTPRSGLGLTRAEVQRYFERAPLDFVFKDDPTDQNGPAVRGRSTTNGPEVILRGPADNIREAQVSAVVDGRNRGAVLQAMLALLEVAAPQIERPVAWLDPHLAIALRTGTDTTLEADRTIVIVASSEAKVLVLSVLPSP